jgi:hypothetical protein
VGERSSPLLAAHLVRTLAGSTSPWTTNSFSRSPSPGSRSCRRGCGGKVVLRQPLGRVVPAWGISPPLGGACAARCRLRAGHPLFFSNGVSL